MAADVKALKSYLVALGFDVNTQQLAHFQTALNQSASLVKHNVNSMAGDILKWQLAITGMFVSFGAAVVATVDKVAMADQTYRLFGQQMFMDFQHAKSLKIALDALQQPLENIAFDPELHDRFMQLQKDQAIMQQQLGGQSFESTMRQMRDIRFEFTRFNVEVQYFLMSTAQALFKALGFGSGDFLKTLQRLNSYIIEHIPEWSRMFADDIAPVLKDVWDIIKGIANMLGVAATAWTNLVGIISGNTAIEGTTFSFYKFATAIQIVVHALAKVIELLMWIETHAIPFAGTIGGAIAGGMAGGPAGAVVGGIGGGIIDAMRHFAAQEGNAAGGGSNDIRSLAAQVGSQLGVSPDIIYSQWAHETGNFTNRGATSLNNLAGIRLPGSTEYRSFSSLGDFGNYYAGLIQRRYKGALGAQSIDDYASALKRGGYFEDSLSNYEKGMHSHAAQYSAGGATSSIVVGDINIMQPHASPEQIKGAVASALKEHQGLQVSRNVNELKSAY